MSLEVMVRVIRTSKATGPDYLLLLLLAERAQPHGVCWPGARTLARDAHLENVRSVQRGLGRLREQNEIETVPGSGRVTTVYWLRRYANPSAVAEFLDGTDPRFEDVRGWVLGLMAAGLQVGIGTATDIVSAQTPIPPIGAETDIVSAPTPMPTGTRKEPERKEPGIEPGGVPPLAWGPLLARISESFGGIRTTKKDGQAVGWAGSAVGMLGRAAGDDLDEAVRLWGLFDADDARDFVKNPERSLVGQLGSWLGRYQAGRRRHAAMVGGDDDAQVEEEQGGPSPEETKADRTDAARAAVRPLDGLWLEVLRAIEGGIPRSQWVDAEPVLGRVLLGSLDGGVAVLFVPDQAAELVVTRRLAVPVSRSLEVVAGRPVRVETRPYPC